MSRTDDDVARAAALTTPGGPVTEDGGAGSAAVPEAGSTFGRYRIEHHIGQGGMGMVFAAEDPELDRRVALKILRSGDGSGSSGHSDPREEARLLREARAMAQLTHPNVIAVFDVGTHGGRPFIAMEFVEGETLEEWLRTPCTVDETLRVFTDAGRGLAAAHAEGLVHRDFKPSNVLVGNDGRVRVLDFGLVRGTDSSAASSRMSADTDHHRSHSGSGPVEVDLTDDGLVMGTPVYMSPEQHLGAIVDERSDQFSFCVALYEALFGQRPFVGLSVRDIGKAKSDGDLRRTPSDSKVPSWLRRVVLRGLDSIPERRWPSMDALLRAATPSLRAARRRRMAALTIAAVGVGGAALTSTRGAAPCDALGAGLETEWTPERRDSLAAALQATGVGFADTTWTRIEPRIGTFIESWNGARQDVCIATRVEGTRDDLAFDISMACLDRQRSALTETLDVIATADSDVASRAVSLVARLADPWTCTRSAEGAAFAPPKSAEQAARVERARHLLERAAARSRAGQVDAALEAASEAWETAQATDYDPVQLEAQLARGKALSEAGQFQEAESVLTAAHWRAVELRHDEVGIESALWLASMVGNLGERNEDGLSWARHAESAIDRAGGDAYAELRRLDTVATLYRHKGKLDRAGVEIADALKLAGQTSHEDDLMAARLLTTGASIDADAGHYPAAREKYERALAIQAEILGDDHPNLGSGLDGLGRVRFFMDDAEGALRDFERSLGLREKAWGEDHPAVATSLNNVAATLRVLRRGEEAIGHYQRALQIRENLFGANHTSVAIILINMAAQQYNLSQVDAAIASNQRALSIFENAHGPDHPDVCMVLNNLGLMLEGFGKHQEALAHHRRALEIRDRILPDNHPDRALSRAGVARVERILGSAGQALEHAREALAMYEVSQGPDHSDTGMALVLIGAALNDLSRNQEALPLLERAAVIYDREENRAFDSRERGMFELARALWATEIDRERACELATAVRGTIAQWDASYERDRAAVGAWLKEHASCR